MKKILLTCGVASLLLSQSAKAQLAMQNFNAAGIPAGWLMINVDGKTPNPAFSAAIINGLTANAYIKWPRVAGDSCMLTTSYFDPVGQADRWLITPQFLVNDANSFLTWEDFTPDASFPDAVEVKVSMGGTTTADFTTTLYSGNGTLGNFGQKGVSLAAYNGQNIRIAFRNNSNDKFLLYLDNIGTTVLSNPLDVKVNSVTFQPIGLGNQPVSCSVTNVGNTTITSINANYTVDGGTPVPQNFTGLNIAPFGSATLTFSTNATGPVGAHVLAVTATQVNGGTDANTADNSATSNFTIASQSVTRAGLIEEFSSSTCPPCASFNAVFDPLALAQNANVVASNFNVIKYQMNWPGLGNDASYNAHADARKTYYGVSGIPDHYTNGKPGGAGDLAEINASKTAPAFVTINGSYTINTTATAVNVNVIPHFTATGTFKVYIAAVERYYQNTANTTGQLNYRYIMRKMFPDGGGNTVASFTNNTPVNFNFSVPFVTGSVAQMNFNFWGSPISTDLVVFVQNTTTDEIYQSRVIAAQWPTDVPTIGNETKVLVYPNPASDYTVVGLDMQEAANVSVNITDATGRVVYKNAQQVAAGRHDMPISTASMAAGLYNVTITTEKGSVTQRLSVVK